MTQDALIDGRTARRDRNRRAVLDAVLDLFAAGDLSPSPEAVAQRSGLSLRSVYRYVADNDDLVQAAIERHLEKVGPLFAIPEPGQGSFQARVLGFVTARMALYEAVAPTARAAQLRAQLRPGQATELIRERLDARRRLLRAQLERQFAPELAELSQHAELAEQGQAALAAADVLTQIETIDWFLVAGGYTSDQARAAVTTGLLRLLGPPGP